jgi:hypothetical protein
MAAALKIIGMSASMKYQQWRVMKEYGNHGCGVMAAAALSNKRNAALMAQYRINVMWRRQWRLMHQPLQRINHGMALWHQYGVLNIGGVNHEKRNGGGWRLGGENEE